MILQVPPANSNEKKNPCHSLPKFYNFVVEPYSDLIESLSNEGISFQITPVVSQDGTGHYTDGTYRIGVFKDNKSRGGMLISPANLPGQRLYFEPHVSLHDAFRRKGIGSIIYAMAAHFVYTNSGTEFSTPGGWTASYPLWKSLVKKGWAIENPDIPGSYRFRKDLLKAGFFKDLEGYINGFEEMSFDFKKYHEDLYKKVKIPFHYPPKQE